MSIEVVSQNGNKLLNRLLVIISIEVVSQDGNRLLNRPLVIMSIEVVSQYWKQTP